MAREQVTVPWLACPKCLRKLPIHEIKGEPQIFRHVKRCDVEPQADGFVEASELAGVESANWHDDWREFVIRSEGGENE